ncbi:MAG: ABC transporter substrate-binding protein [Treponemataceae bacterium]
MNSKNIFHRIVSLAALLLCCTFSAFAQNEAGLPSRVVLGGRAVIMVADAVYAFPSVVDRVLSVAGTDQGLGAFLGALDPSFVKKPALDRSATAESFAALKPDLVILKSMMKGSLGKSLEALSLRTLYLDLETPEDYFRDLAALGKTFGDEKRADALISYYRSLVADTVRRVSGQPKPRTLLVQAASGAGLWEAPPAAWMQTTLVKMAGGDPVWVGATPGNGWTRLNVEQIAAWNPEVVIVVSYREDSAKSASAFKTDPRFANLSAVKASHVFAMPQDFYSWDQPDTRWVLGLRRIGAFLHPSSFFNADAGGEAKEFFRILYGIDKMKFESVIAPRLKGDHGVK